MTMRPLLPIVASWSARVQPSHSDRDEPAHRSLGRHAAGRCEGVEAIARELVRRNIIAEGAGFRGLGQQVSDHVAQLLLRSGDLLVSMEEGHEFGVVAPVGLVGDERDGLEHSFESLASVARGHGAVGVQASGA